MRCKSSQKSQFLDGCPATPEGYFVRKTGNRQVALNEGSLYFCFITNYACAVERNYDELFAEMLMQIDRHTEELDKHSMELTKQSEKLTKQSEESTRRWVEQHTLNQSMLTDLKQVFIDLKQISTNMEGISAYMKDMEKISHQHLDQMLATATILDRIIRKNQLKV